MTTQTPLTPLPFWKTDRFWWVIYFLVTLFVTLKEMLTEPQSIGMVKIGNNNFTIFYQSFHHLWEGKTLYGFYPQEYDNRYNYSPFFAVLMMPFALLPYTLGGILWNICNGIFFFSALQRLHIDANKKVLVYICLIFDTFTTLNYFQTNPSVTALIIWTLVFLERGQLHWATCMLMLGTWTKIIPLLAGVLWFLYPKKGLFVLYCLGWSALFFFTPLLFVSFKQLIFLHQDWYVWVTKHTEMHGATDGLMNLYALLRQIFQVHISLKYFIVVAGILLLGGIAYKRAYAHELTFKMLVLANVLIFLVIFNPGAESPTFIIASTGIVIWYIYGAPTYWRVGLGIFAFVIVAFAQSDLFPFPHIRKAYIQHYVLKVLPCLLVWIACMVEIYLYKPESKSI